MLRTYSASEANDVDGRGFHREVETSRRRSYLGGGGDEVQMEDKIVKWRFDF